MENKVGAPTLAKSGKDVETLEVINKFVSDNGYSPAIRDLIEPLGVASTSVVEYRLSVLKKNGWITSVPNISRSIVVTNIGRSVLRAKKKQEEPAT